MAVSPTVLVYFRDRLEEKESGRVVFDGIVELLIELGLVKKNGKQRLDSTHILGYVKEMSRLECAVETVRLALEALAEEVGGAERPEFWERDWALYVQSELSWRLSKTERSNRYRQCGQDIKELLEWIDTKHSKLSELEAVKLLRRVFGEQFEVVEGKLEPRETPRSKPHDPTLTTPIKEEAMGGLYAGGQMSIQRSRLRIKAAHRKFHHRDTTTEATETRWRFGRGA
jgi:hypothetical protein